MLMRKWKAEEGQVLQWPPAGADRDAVGPDCAGRWRISARNAILVHGARYFLGGVIATPTRARRRDPSIRTAKGAQNRARKRTGYLEEGGRGGLVEEQASWPWKKRDTHDHHAIRAILPPTYSTCTSPSFFFSFPSLSEQNTPTTGYLEPFGDRFGTSGPKTCPGRHDGRLSTSSRNPIHQSTAHVVLGLSLRAAQCAGSGPKVLRDKIESHHLFLSCVEIETIPSGFGSTYCTCTLTPWPPPSLHRWHVPK